MPTTSSRTQIKCAAGRMMSVLTFSAAEDLPNAIIEIDCESRLIVRADCESRCSEGRIPRPPWPNVEKQSFRGYKDKRHV